MISQDIEEFLVAVAGLIIIATLIVLVLGIGGAL